MDSVNINPLPVDVLVCQTLPLLMLSHSARMYFTLFKYFSIIVFGFSERVSANQLP